MFEIQAIYRYPEKPEFTKKLNFLYSLVKFSKFLRKNTMGIGLPPHAICMQSMKFMPFVDPEKSQ